MATVLVGCRLPNGMILHHPQDRKKTIKLNGVFEPLGEGLWSPPRAYATTEVDADFWNAWKAAYAGNNPLKNRAVFEAKDEKDAMAKAKDSDRTGFEQTPRNAVPGVTKAVD